MNACDSVRRLLSELIDNELVELQVQEVESHIQHCDECRNELQVLRQLDAELLKELILDDVEAKVRRIASKAAVGLPAEVSSRTFHWGAILAAVLLVGFFAFPIRPPKPTPQTFADKIVARLVSATGPVEVLADSDQDWLRIDPHETFEIAGGARIRTVHTTLCELETVGQGKVRMNRGCEVVVNNKTQLELVSGQLWCSASDDCMLEVSVPSKQEFPTVAIFTCPTKSSFQCEATSLSASCSSPPGPEPEENAEAHVGKDTWQVGPGQTVVIDGSQQMTRMPRDESSEIWQLPLLALPSANKNELRSSLQGLLAPIGRTKATHMNETQIRALGPAGAIPLLSFVIQTPSTSDQSLRRTAMRLASATADQSAIPMLQQLTADADPVIASQATSVLERLAKSV